MFITLVTADENIHDSH